MKLLFTVLLATITFYSFAQTNYTLNGNLGVGENPTHKLSVAGDSKMTGELTVTDKTKLEAGLEVSGDLKLVNVTTTGTDLERLLYIDSDGKVQRITSQMWQNLITEAAENVYKEDCNNWANNVPVWGNAPGVIYADGGSCGINMKLGINTSTPDATLEIHPSFGNGNFDNSFAIKTGLIERYAIDFYGKTTIYNQSPEFASFVIKDQNDNTTYQIKGTGEISLYNQAGTAKPLVVQNTNAQEVFKMYGTGEMRFLYQETDAQIIKIKDINGQETFNIRGSGEINIFNQEASANPILIKDNNNQEVFKMYGTGEVRFFNQELNAQPIKIKDINGQETFNIKGNGAVRIFGQLAATKTFSIQDELGENDVFRIMGNGHVWSTEVHVRLKDNFPDYVFEDDYNLMSLEELRSYIKSNKKLPNMPSAEKVASDGLDLGETDRLLTEKVEELTLYILQLKDELDALREENKAVLEAIAK